MRCARLHPNMELFSRILVFFHCSLMCPSLIQLVAVVERRLRDIVSEHETPLPSKPDIFCQMMYQFIIIEPPSQVVEGSGIRHRASFPMTRLKLVVINRTCTLEWKVSAPESHAVLT